MKKWLVRILLLALALAIALSFTGLEPLASIKDNVQVNWGLHPEDLEGSRLHGRYVAKTFDILRNITVTATASFKDDTVTFKNSRTGKTVCTYHTGHLGSSRSMHLTDIATGESTHLRFNYSAKGKCFTLAESPTSHLTFHKITNPWEALDAILSTW